MSSSCEDDYELPDEIDFSKLKRVPNPFSQRFQDLNLVSLDEDVKAVFPDSESVNAALRSLIENMKAASAYESEAQEMQKAS